MASRNNEEAVVDHTAQKGSVEGQINPILPSTDPFVLAGLGAKDAVPKPYGKVSIESEHVKTKLEHVKTESAIMTEDNIPMPEAQLETLNSEHLQLDQAPLASGLSKVVHNPHLPQPQRKSVQDTSVQSAPECSASQLPEEFYGTDSAHTPSSLNPPLSPTSSRKSQSYNSSKPVSPEICGTVCEDHIPPLNPDSTRPASTPNSLNKPLSRRREGPDYPRYPDQSFKALEHQHHPPPYHPGQPHHLRTRSSQPSQKISFYPNEGVDVTEHPQLSSGSKTMGNTPVQSPGLFTPTLSKTRLLTSEPEEMRNPFGYASHLQEMKETHKLLKDVDPTTGRKTVNHYELFQKLGSGQHGTVKLARNMDTGEDVAIKIVRRFSKKLRFGKSGDPNDMIKREVAILKKARHRHVVSLIEVIDDAEFGKVYLVLEFVKRGEIVWRKRTDKDVALFEMERTKREAAHGFNFEFEKMAIEEFNAGAPLRRHGKKQNLEDRKYEEKERYHAAGSGSFDPYFSLEFGGESEDENGSGFLRQIEAQHQRHSLKMGTTDISSQSDTPTDTPKPIPHSIDSEHLPVSVPSSRPQTPASFGGTMWGSYPEQNHSDMALQAMLNEIIAAQTNWDEIDENYRYVPCLTLHHALDAFRDTVLGLEFLHFQGIIHRDIKPANLLWTSDYRVKISDFGVSYLGRPIREDDNNEEIAEADPANLDEAIELAKTVGTPAFYAPELCDPQYFVSGEHQERPAITGQIDVWALGVTLYGMIFGRLPFFHTNEFKMYEKIARDEVFIPKMRLKGVPHAPSANALGSTRFGIKRLDDVLEYEEVSDELRDLLKRLLEKHPSKRITLKEVKHHPWMLQGIDDHAFWIDSTDPSLQSEGRKIEVSTQEVQDAVGGLNVMDRIKNSFQRVSSVLRGRGPRKRGESSAKAPEYASRTPAIKDAASPRDERRTSLRGDEQILPALRASREGSEHPLAQSVTASPEMKNNLSYFDDGGDAVRPASEPQSTRPVLPDRTLSTADSMKTIRAPAPAAMRNNVFSPQTYEEFSTLTTVVDPVPSSASSLGGVFAGAGRRFVNSMRSQERGAGRQSPSQTSRSSSVGTGTDDPHASPSLALSSAIAAGHVDQPPVLREEFEMHHLPNEPTSEEFMHSQGENYRRQTLEHARRRRPSVFTSPEAACPTSPDDEIFFAQRRPGSVSDSTSAFAISSSSDQIVSGESTANSRIPSVVSGASSLSATVEKEDENGLALEKSISPYTIGRRSDSYSRILMESTDHNPRPETTLTPSVAQAAADDDAGYNGDSDSDDEGLAMA